MKASPHFLRLYYSVCRNTNHFTHLLKQVFHQSNFPAQVHDRVHIFNPGIERLNGVSLRVASVTASLSLLLVAALPAKAQQLGPFEEQPRTAHPLRYPVSVGPYPTPVTIDFDKDGDYDVLVAKYAENSLWEGFKYLKNQGTSTQPNFEETSNGNPVGFLVNGSNYAPSPSFSDLDKDGDLDMVVGFQSGVINYYKNKGTYPYWEMQTGAWDPIAKTGNPFAGINFGPDASPYFIDFDKDGDDDIFIGSTAAAPKNKNLHYYSNNGDGSFVEGTITHDITPSLQALAPIVFDIDQDGRYDILAGEENGTILLFKQQSNGSFITQTGASNPFNGIDKGEFSSPALADLDGDSDADIIIGSQDASANLDYFENKGNGTFEEKLRLESPFGGVRTTSGAAPILLDFNGDNLTDILVAAGVETDGQSLKLYTKNNDGSYTEADAAQNPFAALSTDNDFSPSLVDLNGDGALDLVGAGLDRIQYFKKEGTQYIEQNFETGPFKDITYISDFKTDFADLDADGDVDFVMGTYDEGTNNTRLRFFKNTGTSTAPVFTEQFGAQNPLALIAEEYDLTPRFIDIDHDGDLDALVGEGGGVIEGDTGNEFIYCENTGTPSQPTFVNRGSLITPGKNGSLPFACFVDEDGDGDLDLFQGDALGYLNFYRNDNTPATTTITTSTIDVHPGSPVIIDAGLLLQDDDNDAITEARITFDPYEPGDGVLTATPPAGITSTFDATTGVLTLKGKASINDFQAALRSVTVAFMTAQGGGGKAPSHGRAKDYTRTVSIQVFDADHTTPVAVSIAVNFVESVSGAEGPIIVYNAVAPHSSGDNQWMRILNLPAENTVTIFNRWGDEVFKVQQYSNDTPGKRFEGLADNGKELPSGTYFYKITAGGETVTGYLALKQ